MISSGANIFLFLGGHLHACHQIAKWTVDVFTSTLHGGIIWGVHGVNRKLAGTSSGPIKGLNLKMTGPKLAGSWGQR